MVAEAKAERPPVAFYCVSSGVYFLGAVAMLNSLRLVGHTEPVFMLDCGLRPRQRELLAAHVTLLEAPSDAPPYLLKTVAPLRHPAEVRVLIDVDMVVTRALAEPVELAAEGRLVAFRNNLDRFVPEWGELLDLGPIRRQPYLSSGLVLLGGRRGDDVLRLMDDRQARVEFELTYARRNVADYPFLLLDQDILNAIAASRVESDRIVPLDLRLAPNPPFPGLRLMNEETLRCAYEDGTEPYVLHHLDPRKPWRGSMYRDIYSRLLGRLLLSEDVALRVPDEELPRWMRDGLLGRAERARHRLGWYVRDHLSDSIVDRIDALRRRRRRPEGL
jgi:hypothetical protein